MEALPGAQVKGHYAFYLLAAQGLGSLLHPRRRGRLPQVAGPLVEGLLQAHALVGQPPLRIGWLSVTPVQLLRGGVRRSASTGQVSHRIRNS
ncbi:UNVERIFIED_CONTAM: hypothetical protein Slati_2478000 [Sesamum latifolium]|uniref:Uncharacterized protein n=1 Tax=Sesamum latifolium TaxID=2727402 RepID=A0AAW2WIC7_9LAMI